MLTKNIFLVDNSSAPVYNSAMLGMLRRGLFFIITLFFARFNFVYAAEESILDLEPIVVTKSKVHLLVPYSIKSEELTNSSFSSALEALSYLPLDLQSRSIRSGIQTDFSLRGSTFQGVLMLLDGQRINDPQTAHHNSDIPLTKEDVARMEVLPGVSSSIFGPDAIGGAINIIRKKPQEKKMVFELGSGEHQVKSGLISISDKINNLGVRVSLENRESDGFYTDTDFKKFTAAVNSSLDVPDGEFNLNWGYQEKEFGAYDFYTPKSGYLSKEWTRVYLLDSSLNLNKGGFVIKPNFLWRRHYDKFMLDKTSVRSRSLNHHRTDVYTPGIYLQNEIRSLGRLGLGLEYGEERIDSTNLGGYNRKHKSVFLDDSKDLNDKASLGASFRWDDFDGFAKSYTGSLSAKYKLSESGSFGLGISRSMRIPSFTELYYNDSVTLGNSALSRERSLNYQIGYEYKKEGFSWGTTLFYRQEDNFIDWIKRAPTQAKWQAENITESQVAGTENYLRIKINQFIDLDSNYTYVNKRINDQGYLYKYGPNYINHLVNTTLNFNLSFGQQSIGATYKKKPARRGWFLLNPAFSYNLNKNSRIFLKITNILNVEYQEIEGIPQPGRWAEAGLRFDW